VRVCLDTNVLVAAFATRGLCADVLRAVLADHELVLGEVVMTELRRALVRKLKVSEERLALVESVFSSVEILGRPTDPSPLAVRDEDDRWILATALMGRADVLVTGDEDLLTISATAPLPILAPRAFWELLRGP
jgi:uncharacterized protein